MQRIEFFFDPSCPFCWITSRWLLQVSEDREVEVAWRPFSLAEKNNELGGDGADLTPHGDGHRAGHRVLRIIAAAQSRGCDVSTIDIYSAFGRAVHVEGRPADATLTSRVLADLGLPADLADAGQDTSWDAHLRAEMNAALDVVGEDAGVPIIVFVDEQGERRGYFGPVLNTLPGHEEALALWDGLSAMADVTAFYELKRTRPDGGPDTQSTSGL